MSHIKVKNKKIPMYWLRMRDYSDQKWEIILDRIECQYLKVKVASIIYWDLISYKEAGTEHYIKSLMKQYDFKIDQSNYYNDNDLEKALLLVGYPRWIASKRSKSPKTDRYYSGR
tara:strand:+ start:45 stop:389 length:345 start_codon:yes stop_codon:yes gene_type:complete